MFMLKKMLPPLAAPLLLLLTLSLAAACSPQNTVQAQPEMSSASEAGDAFGVYADGTPLAGAVLRLHDADGNELERAVSDAAGRVDLPRTEEGGKLLISAPGHADREITLPAGLSGAGGAVEYKQATAHKEFSVDLPVISGTGYAWQLASGGDALLVGDETLPSPNNLPGAPAVQRLTLDPTSATGQILLVYARSWEKDVPPAQWRILLFEPSGQ